MNSLFTQPIIIIGAPRSGTTVIFEYFAQHPDLAWVSNYSRAVPKFPAINIVRRIVDNSWWSLRGKKNQFADQSWYNYYLPRPDESYEFWNVHSRPDFATGFLLGEEADFDEAQPLRISMEKTRAYQGRKRLTAKLTGPGRITYLNSIWPDACFIHVVRNGLEVVRSLLNADFWKDGGGYEHPWWVGGLTDRDRECWELCGNDPGVLAAMQWKRIVETTQEESTKLGPDKYFELRYEDFVQDPQTSINNLYKQVGLESTEEPLFEFSKQNQQYSNDWSDDYRKLLVRIMEPAFGNLGYKNR